MKIKTFPGNRYDVTVKSDTTNGYFEIFAMHKTTSKQSSVTNLNIVISEILNPILETKNKDIESNIWITNHIKHGQLVKWATKCFKDKYWIINHLEEAFDDDRELGEWNN